MAAESNSFPQFLNDFEQTIESTAARLLSLPDELRQQSHSAEKWTRKQILGHLIDSAANNHQRFVKAQFTDALVFPGYEQEQWVDAGHYNDEDWSRLVQLWKLYNLHLAHLASFISPEILSHERTEHNLNDIAWQAVDKTQPVTLEYFIRDYAGHMRHHLTQIFDST